MVVGQRLITPTVEICIHELGRIVEMVLSLCKICLVSMLSFRQSASCNNMRVGLEMLIHAPTSQFWDGFNPGIRSGINTTPKRHFVARKHVINLSTDAGWVR